MEPGLDEDRSLSKNETPVTPEGITQDNLLYRPLVHFSAASESLTKTISPSASLISCLTRGFAGKRLGAAISSGAETAPEGKVKLAFPNPDNMLVPSPSFAKIEPLEKFKAAAPDDLTRKVMLINFPSPENPGFKAMPSNLTLPIESTFEKEGSCTQRLNTEPVLEILAASSLSVGKVITPEAALSDVSD